MPEFLKKSGDCRQFYKWLLVFLILLGVLIRFYHVDFPLADSHAWKQTDEASLSYNLYQSNLDLAKLKIFSLRALDANSNYFFEEAPLFAFSIAALYKLFGVHDFIGHLFSIFFSLLSMLWFVGLLRRYLSPRACCYSLFFLIFSPLNWFYSRAFMPDSAMVSASLGVLYYFDGWLKEEKRYQFWCALLLSVFAVTIKYYGVFVFAPIFFLAFRKFKWRTFLKPELFLMFLLSILPTILWFIFVLQHPYFDNPIRNAPHWGSWTMLLGESFYGKIFWSRMTERIVLQVGFWCAVIAIGWGALKKYPLLGFWLLQPILHCFIFRQASFLHEYYQFDFVAPMAALAGIGVDKIRDYFQKGVLKRIWPLAMGILCLAFLYQSFLKTANLFRANLSPVISGEKMRELSEPGDRIILFTSFPEPDMFAYYAKRETWLCRSDAVDLVDQVKNFPAHKSLGARFIAVLVVEEDFERFAPVLSPVLKGTEKVWEQRGLPREPDKIRSKAIFNIFRKGWKEKKNEDVIFQVYRL